MIENNCAAERLATPPPSRLARYLWEETQKRDRLMLVSRPCVKISCHDAHVDVGSLTLPIHSRHICCSLVFVDCLGLVVWPVYDQVTWGSLWRKSWWEKFPPPPEDTLSLTCRLQQQRGIEPWGEVQRRGPAPQYTTCRFLPLSPHVMGEILWSLSGKCGPSI